MSSSLVLNTTAGSVVGIVKKSSNAIIVSIPSKFEVTLRGQNNLFLRISEKYKNFLRGLCGDYNGEKAADLKSPKGCIFKPAQGPIFATSWIGKKDDCHESPMKELMQISHIIETERCTKTLSYKRKTNRQ